MFSDSADEELLGNSSEVGEIHTRKKASVSYPVIYT